MKTYFVKKQGSIIDLDLISNYNIVPKLFFTAQPYRTTPLVLPNPKTILDAGEAERKYCTQTVEKKELKVTNK